MKRQRQKDELEKAVVQYYKKDGGFPYDKVFHILIPPKTVNLIKTMLDQDFTVYLCFMIKQINGGGNEFIVELPKYSSSVIIDSVKSVVEKRLEDESLDPTKEPTELHYKGIKCMNLKFQLANQVKYTHNIVFDMDIGEKSLVRYSLNVPYYDHLSKDMKPELAINLASKMVIFELACFWNVMLSYIGTIAINGYVNPIPFARISNLILHGGCTSIFFSGSKGIHIWTDQPQNNSVAITNTILDNFQNSKYNRAFHLLSHLNKDDYEVYMSTYFPLLSDQDKTYSIKIARFLLEAYLYLGFDKLLPTLPSCKKRKENFKYTENGVKITDQSSLDDCLASMNNHIYVSSGDIDVSKKMRPSTIVYNKDIKSMVEQGKFEEESDGPIDQLNLDLGKVFTSLFLFNPILVMDTKVNDFDHNIRVPYSYNMTSGFKSFEIPFESCLSVKEVEKCISDNLFI
jgi:hypothetical protein